MNLDKDNTFRIRFWLRWYSTDLLLKQGNLIEYGPSLRMNIMYFMKPNSFGILSKSNHRKH
nr:hypothetical protein [Mycoplasmopsis bovis]